MNHQTDSHDISIRNSIHFHRPIIVLGSGILLFFYVIVGIFAATHWLTFVAMTEWITIGTFVFVGLLAVLALYIIFTRHQEHLKDRQTKRLLPHVLEHVIVMHKAAPYTCTPISEEHIRYNIKVDEHKRKPAMLSEPLTLAIEQPDLGTIIESLRPNTWQFCYGSDVHTGELIRATLPQSVHMQLVGSSGQGKSRQAQSMLTQLVATNDEYHLQLAILDHEEETSLPFHGLPHVRYLATDEREAARTLRALCAELVRRDQLSREQIGRLPIILVFVEEFLNLRRLMKGDMRDQALEDFTTLALRGRKRGMFIMAIGQTSYTEKPMRDALAQFLSGIAFAMRPQAARSAGFTNTELLNRLYSERRPAQFLLERRGDDRLVLSPYVDDHGEVIEDVLTDITQERSAPYEVVPMVVPTGSDGGSEVVPEESMLSNGNHDGNQWEPDLTILALMRGMLLENKSQNEVCEKAFPGMRKADAITEYRKYLGALIK